jgi:hypothetical protein
MASTLNEVRVVTTPVPVEPTETTSGLRLARFCALEEALGVIFGVLTVAYIVTSLFALN